MTEQKLNVGVVGATGVVGEEFLKLLHERQFPVAELRLFASDRSAGSQRSFAGRDWPIQSLSADCFHGLDLVFFSSGDDISKQWAPVAERAGAVAVDNSAAFREDPERALVVPEVNGHLLPKGGDSGGCIIANPNCSTIQLVVALGPLAKAFGLESIQVASYQAVSGAGRGGQEELAAQTKAWVHGEDPLSPQTFPHPIAFNCVPQIGSFQANGFCTEELKIRRETKKILGLPDLRVSAFTVRVPVWNSHSEAAWVRLKTPATRQQILTCWQTAPGLVVQDEVSKALYPLAKAASSQDPVFVGRLHQDLDDPQLWLMWIVADNLRKGAALNGVQIAERIFDIPKHP